MSEGPIELTTIVLIDQRERWSKGECPFVESYVRDVPELSEDREGLLDVIYQEVLLREESGDSPAVEEYLRRFPNLNGELRRQFEVHRALPPPVEIPLEEPAEDLPRIDGYVLAEEIGRGSFGVVYRAWERSLNRTVALKLISDRIEPGRKERDRFFAEAHSAARLTHPNIVQIHAIGTTEECSYFCLEHIQGGTLAEFLDGRPQPFLETAEFMATLAAAVHYAHLCQVVHCDLKPGNILLQVRSNVEQPSAADPDDSAERPPLASFRLADFQAKIADFGLARRLDAEVAIEPRHLSGTLPYMAPEQLSRQWGAICPATDIHGLGTILYEMLTGRPPFAAESKLQVFLKVRDGTPAPLKELRPDTPPDLEAICQKCLERDPQHRYPTAQALADDLHRFVEGREVSVRRLGPMERMDRWRRRNPQVAGLLALLVVISVASFIVVTAKMVQAQRAENNERKRADELDATLYLNQFLLAYQSWLSKDVGRAATILEATNPARRSLEFAFLRRLLAGQRDQWPTDQKNVSHLAYSPDGAIVAVADRVEPVALVDAASGKQLRTVSGHGVRLATPVFSPDGASLASAGMDDSQAYARIWSVATGELTRKLGPLRGPGIAVAYPSNGELLMTLSVSGLPPALQIEVWDIATARRVGAVSGPPTREAFTPKGALSPDGRYFAWTGSLPSPASERGHQAIGIGDATTGKLLHTVKGHSGQVHGMVFSPDGEKLATFGADGVVIVRSVADGKALFELRGHSDAVLTASFSADGQRLASGSRDQSIKIWSLSDGAEFQTLRGHAALVWATAFSPDDRTLLSSAESGSLSRWRLGGRSVESISDGATVTNIAITPGGRQLVTTHLGGETRFRDWNKPGHPVTLRRPFMDFTMSSDGKRMAAVDTAGKLWTTREGGELVEMEAVDGLPPLNATGAKALAWSADRRWIACVLADKATVAIVEVATGNVISTFVTPHQRINDIAFRDDGKQLATAGFEYATVYLWEPTSGKRLREITADASVRALVFRAGNSEVATIPIQGQTIDVWDSDTGERRLVISGHKLPITCLACTRDGRRFLTGSADRTVKIWDAETGTELLTLEGAKHEVRYLAISGDGGMVAAAAGEGLVSSEILVWDASEKDPAPMSGIGRPAPMNQ